MIGDINNSADDLAMRAFEAMVSGEDILALSLLDQLAAEEPDHPLVGWGRARSLLQQGKDKEALQEARKGANVHPEDPMVWYILAGVAWHFGNNSMAQDAYEKCIKFSDEPEIAEIYVQYACFMEDCRAPAIAETVVNKALELAPESPAAWVALGRIRGKQHRLEESESCFKRALEINPEFAPAQMSLGWQFRFQGKTDEANALFKLASDNEHAESIVDEINRENEQQQAWQKIFERKEVQNEIFGDSNESFIKRYRYYIVVNLIFLLPIGIVILSIDRSASGLILLGVLTIISVGMSMFLIWLDS